VLLIEPAAYKRARWVHRVDPGRIARESMNA
jgi:hypothetical protein